MMLRSLIEKLGRYAQCLFAVAEQTVHAPLLDATRLRELGLFAQSLPWSLLLFQRPASQPLIGETPSAYRGHGFEFEENRRYQSGDEPRLLNWRLYARTGDLYTKVFAEERRSQVFLVVDRRASMRFATRRRLKAALAAELGACYAWQARQQAHAVGGLILNQSVQWLEPALGDVALHGLLHALAAPCPPLPFEQNQPDLHECLRLLLHRLPGGSFVVVLSDFADLDPGSATALLHQLATLHTLRAIQVLDPVEQRLPAKGEFLIEEGNSHQPLQIDGLDVQQQARYVAAFEARQAELTACFQGCGIPFDTCTTEADVDTCLGQPDADSRND